MLPAGPTDVLCRDSKGSLVSTWPGTRRQWFCLGPSGWAPRGRRACPWTPASGCLHLQCIWLTTAEALFRLDVTGTMPGLATHPCCCESQLCNDLAASDRFCVDAASACAPQPTRCLHAITVGASALHPSHTWCLCHAGLPARVNPWQCTSMPTKPVGKVSNRMLCRYDSDDTPMSFYLNVHETLENRRKEADDEGKGHGPRTVVSLPHALPMHISCAGSAAVRTGSGVQPLCCAGRPLFHSRVM